MGAKYKKYLTQEEALEKMRRYCAYSERSHSDVRSKLIKLEVYGDKLEHIISELISEDYLNEQRYAESYVRGKFLFNKWGKRKILQGLKAKRISDYCIRKGMLEIDDEQYQLQLEHLLTKRVELRPGEPKDKTAAYLIQKGYESALVWKTIKIMIT